MRQYKIIVRLNINIGRPVTDYDLWVMDCYYVSPVFYDDPDRDSIEIVEDVTERYFSDEPWFSRIDSVELVPVT